MFDEERENEEVDVEIFEGEPEFVSSGVLGDGLQDDDQPETEIELGQALGNGPTVDINPDESQTPDLQDGVADA